MRRRFKDRNVRKIGKQGGSYVVTIPIGLIEELDWREKQKIVFEKHGKGLLIVDWKE